MESFSARTKRELCRAPMARSCCAAAESYGALLLGNMFTGRELRIVTTHSAYAARLEALFPKAFGVTPYCEPPPGGQGKHIIAITRREDVLTIRNTFGYGMEEDVALHLNNAVLEKDCCLPAFWRGAFLSGGTVNSPEKKYHLEIATPHRFLARELSALLHESGLEAGLTERAGVQVLYFKASESIEDFLTLAGAAGSALQLMSVKVEKDLRNRINRRVNCDNANLDKTVASSTRKRDGIQKLRRSEQWDKLPDPLRRTAEMRLEYPEESLSQLGERLGVSKSCLNHRLRKIEALAEGLREYREGEDTL